MQSLDINYVIKTNIFILAFNKVPLTVLTGDGKNQEVPDGEIKSRESSGYAQGKRCRGVGRTGHIDPQISPKTGKHCGCPVSERWKAMNINQTDILIRPL